MMPEFAKWPSIQRLSSEICTITEKIDGTNGVIYVFDDGLVLAGSRERWLSKEDGSACDKVADNFGFSRWVYDRREALKRLGPGYHYGEFHGAGIQRGYGLKNKRWLSFAHWRTDGHDIGIHEDAGCVPILYKGEPTVAIIDETVARLKLSGSIAYPGFMKPEGVVITFKEMRTCKFKRLCENDKIHKRQQALGQG